MSSTKTLGATRATGVLLDSPFGAMEPRIAFHRTADGARLAYATLGRGPALLMPPGWVGQLEMFGHMPGVAYFLERLARRHTVVFYDRRGSGLSDRERTDWSLDIDVADFAAIADATAPGRFDVFAYSHGSAIAIAYAATHPERVGRLVLYGSFAYGRAITKPEVRASLVALVRAHWAVGSQALASLFIPGDTLNPEALEDLSRFQRAAASPEQAGALFDSVFDADVRAHVGSVRAKTLIIHRRNDHAIPARLGKDLAASIAGSKLVLLDGDIHLPWLGDADAVLGVASEFLEAEPTSPVEQTEDATSHAQGYRVVALDALDGERVRPRARIALAQLGAPEDQFEPTASGLFRLPRARIEPVRAKVQHAIEKAVAAHADLVVFPEMLLDLNHDALVRAVEDAARSGPIVIAGGFHDEATKMNLARAYGRRGLLWEQPKHIPAILAGGKIVERIHIPEPRRSIVAETTVGRIVIAICRDFLDVDLRVAIKHAEPPIDILLNPAFTPVTADFEAAHFEARRSLYAYEVFCNHAVFGRSTILAPERGSRRRTLPPGVEDVLVKDVDLEGLRAERSRWEAARKPRFVQSTR